MRKRFNIYQILIHVSLVALAATVVGLTQENRNLREPPALEPSQLQTGDTFNIFQASDLDSRSKLVNFAEDEREKLLFIFTTVCPACRENQTNWRTLYEQTQGHYDVVGISLNDLNATVKYRETNALTFPIIIPEDIRDFAMTHKIDRVPLTVQLDRRGRVQNSWLGVLDKDTLAQLTAVHTAKG